MEKKLRLHLAGLTHTSRVLDGYGARLSRAHSLVSLVNQFPFVGDILMVAGALLIVVGVVTTIMSLYRLRARTAVAQLVVGTTVGVLVMSPVALQNVCGFIVRLLGSL